MRMPSKCGWRLSWCRIAPGYVRACSDVALPTARNRHHRAEMAAAARDACPVLGSNFSHMSKTPDLRASSYLRSSDTVSRIESTRRRVRRACAGRSQICTRTTFIDYAPLFLHTKHSKSEMMIPLTKDADATVPIWYKHICAGCITLRRRSVKNPVRRHMVLPDIEARKASMTIQRSVKIVTLAYKAHTVRL